LQLPNFKINGNEGVERSLGCAKLSGQVAGGEKSKVGEPFECTAPPWLPGRGCARLVVCETSPPTLDATNGYWTDNEPPAEARKGGYGCY